jgi:hypothetical protein
VDTLGLILAVVIQSASVQDRNGRIDIVEKLIENWKKIVKILQMEAIAERWLTK